jgi:hypothetical protein
MGIDVKVVLIGLLRDAKLHTIKQGVFKLGVRFETIIFVSLFLVIQNSVLYKHINITQIYRLTWHQSMTVIVQCVRCLLSLKNWDRDFKFHQLHGCVPALSVCLCCLSLQRTDSPSKQSYPMSIAFYFKIWKMWILARHCAVMPIRIFIRQIQLFIITKKF